MYLLYLSVLFSSAVATHDSLAGGGDDLTSPRNDPSPVKRADAPGKATGGDQPDSLLAALLENGSLTQEQYDRFAADQEAPSVSIGPGGLRVRSADGLSSIKVGGRVQVDASLHDRSGVDDALVKDGTELRRARFEMSGTLRGDVSWAAEVDFGNDRTSIKDFWMGFGGEASRTLMIGHLKQPFSLAIEMSSNDIPFVERGVDAFLLAPFVDRAVGARINVNNDRMFAAAGIYGAGVSPIAIDDEGWGLTGRFVSAPILEQERVLHLAVRGSYRKPEDDVRIRSETTNMSNFRVVDTGVLTEVETIALYGGEAVFVRGPFSFGGEYNRMDVGRNGSDYDFSSWHAQATYSITGESRAQAYRIDAGEFKRLRAESPSGRAWEVAARFATIDLNDRALSGGDEDVISLAVNWYYTRNVRFMLDWSHILNTSGGFAATEDAEGVNILTFRAQVNF